MKTIFSKHKQSGFTLIEIAVVLLIIGMLVGSFIGSFADRVETTRRDNTKKQLNDIMLAIIGFASAEGRLPCPTTVTGAGNEQPAVGGACTLQHGFVPGRTLGIFGAYNEDGLLLDSWLNPSRYSVNNTVGTWDFTTTGRMSLVNMATLDPDLVVCDGDSTSGTTCAGVDTLVDDAPFILLSLGKDGSDFVDTAAPGSDQGENSSEAALAANAVGENIAYTVANNSVFVSKDYSSAEATAGQFDDLIIWGSKYVLYSKMIEAGSLP